MHELKVKKFIKLGTAVRYLNDVKFKMGAGDRQPEPLGDRHVLENMRVVLDLTRELKLEGTFEAGAFRQLQAMHGTLEQASRSTTALTMEQAEALHLLARRIRESLLAEGNNHLVYHLEPAEVEAARSPGWPSDVTLELLWRTPWSLVQWLVVLLIGAFALGVTVSESGLYGKVRSAFHRFLEAPPAQGG